MASLSWMTLLRVALCQLLREARAGELRILLSALVIAVATSSALAHFSDRLQGAMLQRAGTFLGADLVLRGSHDASAAQVLAGQKAGLAHAKTVEFSSVLSTETQMQLASVKAVNNEYPLRGQLRSADASGTPYNGQRPAAGELWAEARLIAALQIALGDTVEIGRLRLRVTRVLLEEPDRALDLYSLAPRALINDADLPATGVVQPGSRVTFRTLWRGQPEQLAAYRASVTPTLTPQQRLQTPRDGNRQLTATLERAERYLGLASLVAVLLSGVAVALSAARFAQRRYDVAALLRCFGLSKRAVFGVFCVQLLVLGLLACVLGLALGWLVQEALFYALRDWLPSELPPTRWQPFLVGIAVGCVTLPGFALPPLAALGRVAPLRVLRRDLAPAPLSGFAAILVTLLALALLLSSLGLDPLMTFALLGGAASAGAVLTGFWLLLLKTLRRCLAHTGVAWRLGLGQLLRYPLAAAGQSLAFGLILLAMSLTGLLRGELLDNWQQQLPRQTPNHFALNIASEERDAFAAHLATLNAPHAPLYPTAPGRLISHNGRAFNVSEMSDERGSRSLRRDLNLTWSATLSADNRLVAGHWWDALPDSTAPAVSIEQGLAEGLNIHLGDRLGFDIGGERLEATVTSIRQLTWNSFNPNFFIILNPGSLQDIPVTWMTSFYLAEENAASLVTLARRYPTVTLLPIDALLNQVRAILAQVSIAIEGVLLLVLAAGLVVLFAGIQATLDERLRQGAVLRALGASRSLLWRARLGEFAVLGAGSGVMAALGGELISALLYRWVFDLAWQPHPWLWSLPVLGAVLVGGAGVWGTRSVLSTSPLTLLRES